MAKLKRNIRYKLGSGKPYILHVLRGKRGSWKRLRNRPGDLKAAKVCADAIASHDRRRPLLVKVTDPTGKQVLYMVGLAGRLVERQRSKAR